MMMASMCAASLRVDCGRAVPMESIHPAVEYDAIGVCNSGTTTPGEDIWTKFEMEEDSNSLYPTPPLSPENKVYHVTSFDGVSAGSWQGHTTCSSSSGGTNTSSTRPSDLDNFSMPVLRFDDEPLSWFAEESIDIRPLLELDIVHSTKLIDAKDVAHHHQQPPAEASRPGGRLIQDCMWSTYKKLLKKESEMEQANMSSSSPVKEAAAISSSSSSNSTCENMIYSDCSQPSDCVDPSAIFPYPLSSIITETQLDLDLTPVSTPSDSEEEIDVVTIATIESPPEEKKKSSKKESHKHRHRRIYEVTNCSTPEHDYAKPGPKRFAKFGRLLKRSKGGSPLHQNSHLKRKRLSNGVNAEALAKALEGFASESRAAVDVFDSPAANRLGGGGGSSSSKIGSSKSSSSSCSSFTGSQSASDSEDCDKRVNHNVLERKRRDDLRNAFFRLRDRIPELESKERASKVVILEKSRTYVEELRDDHVVLDMEKEQLARRHKELVARLRKLRSVSSRY